MTIACETIGAGKTTVLGYLVAYALTYGSGFVLVDSKASKEFQGDLLALARRFGREDDVLVLPGMGLGSMPDSQSNTSNPFTTGYSDAIRDLLVSQLSDGNPAVANDVSREGQGTNTTLETWP